MNLLSLSGGRRGWSGAILALAVGVMGLSRTAHAQDLAALASGATNDLQQALADLAKARQTIEAERIPLARELAAMEQRLIDRRAELAKAQRFQENQLVELNALKAEARRRGDEVKFVDSLLLEYARAFRSRLHFVEEPRFAAEFAELEKAVAPELTPAQRLERRAAVMGTALKRADGALGGELFEGRAIDPRGLVQQGKVALVGPVAIFASTGGEVAGPLQQELNKADPSVLVVDRKLTDASRSLVTTGQGSLVFDPTLGNAFKLAALHDSLFEKVAKGGWAMIPLIALGLGAVLVALVKWFELARFRPAREADLQAVLGHLEERDRDQALARARRVPGPAGELLATAVEHSDEKKEYIEEILYEKMLGARTRLERGLPFLALAATTGPLLGLLGTVMGMIATFKLISSFGSGDPKVLAAGISEALIATATGMSVAIPSLLLHAFLSRKAKGIIASMEQTAVGFINGIPDGEIPSYR